MVRPDRIKSEMFGGVGWRQSTLSGSPVIDTDNLVSKSGLIFQEATFFVTTQNISDTQEDKSLDDDGFNELLKQMQESVILESCQKVEQNQTDFIQSNNIYPYEKSFKNTLDPSNRFVGFQVENIKNTNLLNKIPWVELSFDLEVTFNVYLFNSNLPASPIKTQSITTVANESVIVNLDDWNLADDETHKGGAFYWGYFEDDLGVAKAIARDFELANLGVTTNYNYILPVSMTHDTNVIDITSVTTLSDTSGLNFGIETYNDWTEKFIRNKAQFYQVIQYQMAEKVFNLILSSVRSNSIERITKDMLSHMAFEMYGDRERGITGIEGKLKRSVDNLRKAMFYEPRITVSTLA